MTLWLLPGERRPSCCAWKFTISKRLIVPEMAAWAFLELWCMFGLHEWAIFHISSSIVFLLVITHWPRDKFPYLATPVVKSSTKLAQNWWRKEVRWKPCWTLHSANESIFRRKITSLYGKETFNGILCRPVWDRMLWLSQLLALGEIKAYQQGLLSTVAFFDVEGLIWVAYFLESSYRSA